VGLSMRFCGMHFSPAGVTACPILLPSSTVVKRPAGSHAHS
jgi:hypothetical protein